MAECYIYINSNYKEAFENYLNIDETGECVIEDKKITYKDMTFLDKGEWCLIITMPGDFYDEEILKQMSKGNKLVYFYTDEDQLDAEFIAINNNTVLRRFLCYGDTPELNADDGKLKCEKNVSFQFWNDLDQLIELANSSVGLFFA